MKEKIMELQNKMMIDNYYNKGNIEKIINKIDNLDCLSFSDNCDDKNWVKFIGTMHGKLDLLKQLILSKKIQKNKQDVIEVGKYLQKLGKELEQFDENNLDNEEPKKENEETIDNLIDNLIDKIVNEIFGDDE